MYWGQAMQTVNDAIVEFKKGSSQIQALYQAVCQSMITNIGSTRASVWSFNIGGDQITCEMLLDTRTGKFSSGTVLKEEDFPEYFEVMKTRGKIMATDAVTHPATACFDDIYFTPLDIRSLLDTVVMEGKRPAMVLCCEHCETKKDWTLKHIQYLMEVGSTLSSELNR